MKLQIWLSTLIVAINCAMAPNAMATIVDFQSINNGNNILSSPTDVQGLTFASDHFHIIDTASACSFGGCVTPTNYLALDAPGLGFPVSVTLTGGGIFSVLALDASKMWADSIAAHNGGYDNADFLHLVGNLNGGGVVTHDLQLGFGFSPFTFSDLTNLDSMVISGFVTEGTNNASWAVDNINYLTAAVPEPETYAMMLAGIGMMGFMVRRRKNGQT